MIYLQPLDITIKTKCSFSTVCVGKAFSLSCTSDDDEVGQQWVSQAAQNNYNKPQQKEKLLLHLLALVSFCDSHLVYDSACISACFCHPAFSALAVSSVQREGHIFSYISCFEEHAWAPSQVMVVI